MFKGFSRVRQALGNSKHSGDIMSIIFKRKTGFTRRFSTVRRLQIAFSELAATIPIKRSHSTPFVFVTGLHSSGSSALAGVLYHLGVHMGNKLGGYYGDKPEQSCGYEDEEIANFCDRVIPAGAVQMNCSRDEIETFLRRWITRRRREAWWMGTVAGCKYPKLCPMSEFIQEIVGKQLLVIDINRPLNE
jgi:hypothetical protein